MGRDAREELEVPVGPQQVFLSAFSFGDVIEKKSDFSFRSFPDPERVNVVPPLQPLGPILEPDRFSGERHASVRFKPVLFVGREKLAHSFSDGVVKPGLILKYRVHLQEKVVDRVPRGVEYHLNDAKPFIYGVEQGPEKLEPFLAII
jgi:hypothetical protein